jgi:hypothetical protein
MRSLSFGPVDKLPISTDVPSFNDLALCPEFPTLADIFREF